MTDDVPGQPTVTRPVARPGARTVARTTRTASRTSARNAPRTGPDTAAVATVPGSRSRPTEGRTGSHVVQLATLIRLASRRRAFCDYLGAELEPLARSGMVAVLGELELLSLLEERLQQADQVVSALVSSPAAAGQQLRELEQLLDDPAWELAADLATTELPVKQEQQRQAAVDIEGRVEEWDRRLEEVRRAADEAPVACAPIIAELAELAVLSDLVTAAKRALHEGSYSEAVVPLHRLDHGPTLPCKPEPRPVRQPEELVEIVRNRCERGRELLRHAELLLLRTPAGDRRSSYMVLLRTPLTRGAHGISVQGRSTLVDGDRDYLRGLIATVTAKVNAGNARRVRPTAPPVLALDAGPVAAAGPSPYSLDSELRDVGDLLYRLVVPDSIQRILAEEECSLTIATNDLELPWELMWSAGEHACLRRPVARMPLGYAQPRRAKINARTGARVRFLLVHADPQRDLPEAGAEVRQIEEALKRDWEDRIEVHTLLEEEATNSGLNDALRSGRYDVIHYAGHAMFDEDDPDMSGLLVERDPDPAGGARRGGEMFHSEKIQRLVEGRPLVFLNACETGRSANEQLPGGEAGTRYLGTRAGGLAAAFLYGGALGCIGSLWPVYDKAAAEFAISFYNRLLEGNLVGEALRQARLRSRERYADAVTWAAYSLHGDPTYSVTAPGHRATGADRAG